MMRTNTTIQVRQMRAGASGKDAWTPVIAVVPDGFRLVMQIRDWAGGRGEKPQTGLYIGPAGYVDEIAKAVDVKGVGQKGWSPSFAAVFDGARCVLKVQDWTGGEGEKPGAGLYVGFSGLTDDIAVALDVRGVAGVKGDKGETGSTGLQGATGSTGPQGAIPDHQWVGTSLSFQKPDGMLEAPVNLQGPQGAQGLQGNVGNPANPDAITNTYLANMPAGTIKGALTAGDPQDLTSEQAREVLDVYSKEESAGRYVELNKSWNDWTGFAHIELKDTASNNNRRLYNSGGSLHWSDTDWNILARIHSDGNIQAGVWANPHNNFLSTYVDWKGQQAIDWAYNNLVQDVRLSGWWETGRSLNNWVHCPSGGVVTAWLTQQTSAYDVVINVLGGRYLQALRGGNWYTVGVW